MRGLLQKRAARLLTALDQVPPDALKQVCADALRSCHMYFPSDVSVLGALLEGAGDDGSSGGKYTVLRRILAHPARGASAWLLLQTCEWGALREWVGGLHCHESGCVAWPAAPGGALLGLRSDEDRGWERGELAQRDMVGYTALALCAAEPACDAWAAVAGLLGATSAQGVQGGVAGASGGGGAGGDAWGLYTWEPTGQCYGGALLRELSGAQLARIVAPLLRPELMSEMGAFLARLDYEEDDYRQARAWESDDGLAAYRQWDMLAEMCEEDAALTAAHCDDSHVGAALWAVAAALVQLHGGAAVEALMQWGDEKVRAAPLYKDHLRSVLWRLANMMGEAMPQCPEVTAAAK